MTLIAGAIYTSLLFATPLDLQVYLAQSTHYQMRGGCEAMPAADFLAVRYGDCKDFANYAAQALQDIPGVSDVRVAVFPTGADTWHAVTLYNYQGRAYVMSNGIISQYSGGMSGLVSHLRGMYRGRLRESDIVMYPVGTLDFCGVDTLAETQMIGGYR